MIEHAYAKTEAVVLLAGIVNPRGVMVFPCERVDYPGLFFVNQPRTLLHDQMRERLRSELGSDEFQLDVFSGFVGTVQPPESEACALYVGTISKWNGAFPHTWRPLPELLRAMVQDRNRIEYIKAWQVLTGALQLQTRAAEV